MQIPIVIEPLGDGRFRAQSYPPFTAVVEARTRDEAIASIRQQIIEEIQAGKEILMIDIPVKEYNPILAMAGRMKDNPLFDEWRAAVEAYRRQCDIEAGIELDQM